MRRIRILWRLRFWRMRDHCTLYNHLMHMSSLTSFDFFSSVDKMLMRERHTYGETENEWEIVCKKHFSMFISQLIFMGEVSSWLFSDESMCIECQDDDVVKQRLVWAAFCVCLAKTIAIMINWSRDLHSQPHAFPFKPLKSNLAAWYKKYHSFLTIKILNKMNALISAFNSLIVLLLPVSNNWQWLLFQQFLSGHDSGHALLVGHASNES